MNDDEKMNEESAYLLRVSFVEEQVRDPVQRMESLSDLNDLDTKKRHIIAYFEAENNIEVQHFKKIAKSLKDDCIFHAGYGEVSWCFLTCLMVSATILRKHDLAFTDTKVHSKIVLRNMRT